MNKDGFREEKKPTRGELQISLQNSKAECSQLVNHLQTMGEEMERMFMICFEVLKFARTVRKDLDLVVVMDEGNTDQVKIALENICSMTVGHAAQWRCMKDPSWDPANIALPRDKVNDLVLDVDEDLLRAAAVPERSCVECDWKGFTKECVQHDPSAGSDLCCPLCGYPTDEVFLDNSKQENTDGTKEA